jgi:hypothetical protein
VRAALLLAIAVVACRPQPEPNSDEEITADELEASAARHPDCVLTRVSPTSVVQRWQVESLRGTVSLPAHYRFAPNEEARVRWVDANSSVLELHGTTALGGLAMAGDVGESVHETPCALRFLGRRAFTPRLLLLRANGTDTVFVGAPGMAVPSGGGIQALIFAQSTVARDELLAALTTLQLDP